MRILHISSSVHQIVYLGFGLTLIQLPPANAAEDCNQHLPEDIPCLDQTSLTFAGPSLLDRGTEMTELSYSLDDIAYVIDVASIYTSHPVDSSPDVSVLVGVDEHISPSLFVNQSVAPLPFRSPSGGVSQAVAEEPAENPWRFEIRPYLEVPFAVNGRIEIDRDDIVNESAKPVSSDNSEVPGLFETSVPSTDLPAIELPFDAGFDISNFFLLGGEIEIWYNDIGLYMEGFYADLGSRVLVGFRGEDLIDSGVSLSASYTRFQVSLGWHVGTFPLFPTDEVIDPETAFPAMRLELFGGAEYSQWTVGANLFDVVDLRLDPDWISPIIAANAELRLNSRTDLFVRGKVGGFDLGSAPDFLAALRAGLDWRFFPNVSFRPSYVYRYSSWDSGANGIDLTTNGIWAGLSLNF